MTLQEWVNQMGLLTGDIWWAAKDKGGLCCWFRLKPFHKNKMWRIHNMPVTKGYAWGIIPSTIIMITAIGYNPA